VTSSVGDAVTLACRTSYSDVDWRHQDTPTSGVYYVYSNGVVYDIFRPRFTVDRRPAQGQFDLVISRVQLDDAGLYVCIDDAGLGEPIYIHQLSVIPAGVHTRFTYLLQTRGSFAQTLFEPLIRDVYAFLAIVNSRSRSLYAVVCPSVTLVRPTQAVEIFCNISTAFGTLAIR